MQTAGSAGESIAFGVGVTMPALMLIGFEMDLTCIMVVSILGGLLGILMMIPLRRAFIVKLHGKPGEEGKLLYPEGTACAQVLISAEKGGTSGKTVFFGFGIAFLHKFVTEGMNLLKTTVALPLKTFSPVAAVTGDMASELLGVGYIIGTRISAIMMAGGVMGSLVIAPAIYYVGQNAPGLTGPGGKPLAQMNIGDIYAGYTRFIGAGCVAAAGIISMCRTLPMIIRSFTSGVGTLRGGSGPTLLRKRRTENDLPMSFVLVGCLLLLVLLTVFMAREKDIGLVGGILGSLMVLLFGFLFVTVSSRLTGEIRFVVEPDLRHDRGDLIDDLPYLSRRGANQPDGRGAGVVHRRRGLHRRFQRRHHFARPQDWLSGRRHAAVATVGVSWRRLRP